MEARRSVKADATGRINLGKQCAGRLFTISKEHDKIVLEPARIVPEKKIKSQESIENIILNEKEWSRFQEIMESDDEPTDNLRRLMKDSD